MSFSAAMDDEIWQHGEFCWPRSCSTRNYDRFELYSEVGARSRAPIWRVVWRRIKREKKRMFPCSNSSAVPVKLNYDPCSYSQNFDDQGTSMWADADDISRTFSARFAVSSRFFDNNPLML